MRHLITGGAGFIGSHLAAEIITRGHRVHVLDDLSTGAIDNIRELKNNPGFGYTIDSAASPTVVAELGTNDRDECSHHGGRPRGCQQ
jgi:nucleoside-diphosphate-sugar epimerase